ncbi:MAG: efflux RND transporter permease subunit [bacterium]|nr:efflux RND transporter permease subunit [bacterium]
MSRILDGLSWLITARPAVTLAGLLVATVVLGIGITKLADQADESAFLPEDSEVTLASATIERLFGSAHEQVAVTLIFRGQALTPDGLAQMHEVLAAATSDPLAAPFLVPGSTIGPSLLLSRALGTEDFGAVSQEQIAAAAAELPLERLVGADADGTTVALASLRLYADGDRDGETADDAEALERAQLRIRDLAVATSGPLVGSALSDATTAAESDEATGSQMTLIMIIALAVIAALLLAFTRSPLDLGLSLLGLVLTIVWVLGLQGWLGPEGLGLIGPPNAMTTMVPVMLIGLVVDYAIQTIGLYRESRAAGHGAARAARAGLRAVMLPLSLAAVTTVVSFLTNLSSPIPANADFGVVAGLGVAAGLVVMLALHSAARALIDGQREARGSLAPAQPVSGAIPGVGPAVEALGGLLARRPAPFLVAIAAITVILGVAATGISTEFDSRDFLPRGGDAERDIATLDAAFSGSTDTVQVLVQAELTDDRTVRNLLDFSAAFADDLRRPEGVVGGITSSFGTLLADWLTDDGAADERYDPELAGLAAAADRFRLDPAQMQALIDRVEALDPEAAGELLVDDPDGPDTTLIQFEGLTRDQERSGRMVEEIEALWFGPDEQLTATSGEITELEVVEAMTDSQTEAIATTVIAALVILTVFFWLAEGRPELGVVAVVPIVMVLACVLGTMALADIPYNVITALITALSIGIGVDYTIHIIHRYEEEFARSQDPEQAARTTLRTTGSALLGSALTTALGFGVLVFSSLTPFQQFGLVTAITIAYALIAAIVVVPPAMILWGAYQQHRLSRAAQRAQELLGE